MSPLPSRAAESPEIVISEIAWAGSARTLVDEWIELGNRGRGERDVGGFTLIGVGTSGGALTIPTGTVLAPGETYLIANYGVGDAKTTLAVAPDLVTTAVSVSNTALHVQLLDASGIVVDEVVDPGTPDFGSSITFASMERDLDSLAWQTATSSVNLLDGQLGSPGFIILPAPPPIETTIAEVTAEEPVSQELVIEEPAVLEPVPDEPAINEPVVDNTIVIQPEIEEPGSEVIAPSEPIAPEPIIEEPVAESPAPPEQIVIAEPIAAEPANAEPAIVEPPPEPIVTPQSAAQSEQQPVAFPVHTLLINELESSPEDGVEWIEIVNPGETDVPLVHWSVRDASLKMTMLSDMVLAPHTFFVVENPKGKLNNDTDTVELLDPALNIIDAVAYGTVPKSSPKSGESAARKEDGAWTITSTVTKGAENAFPEPPQEESPNTTTYEPAHQDPAPTAIVAGVDTGSDRSASTGVSTTADAGTTSGGENSAARSTSHAASSVTHTKKAKTKKTTYVNTAIDDIKNVADGTRVAVSGTLVALPGTFGRQIAYLNGLELYMSKADWPTLGLGDVVTVRGTVSTASGHKRIKIVARNDVVITGHTDATPMELTNETPFGTLVVVHGTVDGKSGTQLSLTANNASLSVVSDSKNGVSFAGIGPGDIDVVGILRGTASTPSLSPRTQDDIRAAAPSSLTGTVATTSTGDGTIKQSVNAYPVLGAVLLLGAITFLGVSYMRHKRSAKNTLTLQHV